MSRALPIVAICLSILALALSLVPRDAPLPPPAPAPAAMGPGPEVALLQQRVEALELQNRGLWDRVSALERGTRPQGVPAEAVAVAEAPAPAPAPEAVKALVDQALTQREDEQREARRLELDRRARDQEMKWKDFVTTAHLTGEQQKLLEERLSLERRVSLDARNELGADAPDSRAALQKLRGERRETDRLMNASLDEAQRAQYQAVRRGEQRPGRMR